jgi:predicted esterase
VTPSAHSHFPDASFTTTLRLSLTSDSNLQTDFSDLSQAHDKSGILQSRTIFIKLIADEVEAGIPSSRIVLGGFSQGGAMSLFTGTTIPHKLAGVFGLSSYLLMGSDIKRFADEAKGINKDTPFFMGHGDRDPLVRYEWGVKTADVLGTELGHTVEFKTYRWVSPKYCYD